MIRRPPRSTLSSSSAASDVYKRQACWGGVEFLGQQLEGACHSRAVGPVEGDGDSVGGVVDLAAEVEQVAQDGPVLARHSLTGACAGRAIEPRNQGVRGADVVTRTEGTIAGGASASRQGTPRGQRTRACTEPTCARTGRSHDCPPTRRGAGRSGKAMPYARDERLWEVGQPHSTCEAAEQGRESGCGGGGGKGAGRGEHGQQDAPRTQGRNWCVTCAGSCAPGRAWPNPVSYTHLRAHETPEQSRMPSSA